MGIGLNGVHGAAALLVVVEMEPSSAQSEQDLAITHHLPMEEKLV